jgi:hypothetical protein
MIVSPSKMYLFHAILLILLADAITINNHKFIFTIEKVDKN